MSNETSPPFDVKSNAKGLSVIFKWDMIIKLVMFGVMAWFASGKPGLPDNSENKSSKMTSRMDSIQSDLQQMKTDIAVIKQQLEDSHIVYGSRPSSLYTTNTVDWRRRN